jgi:hypothetical protein
LSSKNTRALKTILQETELLADNKPPLSYQNVLKRESKGILALIFEKTQTRANFLNLIYGQH